MPLKLSIIIPVFNAEEFLERCLDSVLQGNLQEIEVLVIDDASTSKCFNIAREYQRKDHRVKYFRHEFNKGLFSARYTGISQANGEFLVHLDPDDWVDTSVYQQAYQKAKDIEADVVLFNVEQCDETGNKWTEKQNTLPEFIHKDGQYIIEKILSQRSTAWIWHVSWNKLIRTSLAKRILGQFDPNKHLVMYEDLLWSTGIYLELKNKPTICSITQVGYTYFRHKNSITSIQNHAQSVKKIKDIWFVFTQIEKLLRKSVIFKKFSSDFISTKSYVLNLYLHLIPKTYLFRFPLLYVRIFGFFLSQSRSKIQFNTLNITNTGELLANKVIKLKMVNIAIFGTGELSVLLLNKLQKENINVIGFIVSDNTNQKTIEKIPVWNINEANKKNIENIIIGSIGSCYYIEAILRKKMLIDDKKIRIVNVFE